MSNIFTETSSSVETEINTNKNFCLGIDFGTTNSCLSVYYKSKMRSGQEKPSAMEGFSCIVLQNVV